MSIHPFASAYPGPAQQRSPDHALHHQLISGNTKAPSGRPCKFKFSLVSVHETVLKYERSLWGKRHFYNEHKYNENSGLWVESHTNLVSWILHIVKQWEHLQFFTCVKRCVNLTKGADFFFNKRRSQFLLHFLVTSHFYTKNLSCWHFKY